MPSVDEEKKLEDEDNPSLTTTTLTSRDGGVKAFVTGSFSGVDINPRIDVGIQATETAPTASPSDDDDDDDHDHDGLSRRSLEKGNGVFRPDAHPDDDDDDRRRRDRRRDNDTTATTDHMLASLRRTELDHRRAPLSERWAALTAVLRGPLLRIMVRTARASARYPVAVIVGATLFSFACAACGLLTNFYVETPEPVLWGHPTSVTNSVGKWVKVSSGLPEFQPSMVAVLSAGGESVVTVEAMERAFEVFNGVRELELYKELCGTETRKGVIHCNAKSPTGFWANHNVTLFRDDVSTDDGVALRLSSFLFADGSFVERDIVIGNSEPDLDVGDFQEFIMTTLTILTAFGGDQTSDNAKSNNGGDNGSKSHYNDVLDKASSAFPVKSAQSLLLDWGFPRDHEDPDVAAKVLDLEDAAFNVIIDINKRWRRNRERSAPLPRTEPNPYDFAVRVSTDNSRNQELIGSILDDIPTLSLAFLTMMAFCLYSLNKFHRVKSHSTLGIGAVFTIILAILTGYGIMFIFGIPLTTLTYLFPYGMMGLGLDAAFILTGQFSLTDPTLDIVDRITGTVEEVGLSIAVSTLTTCGAYAMGSVTVMLGLRWFCMYAAVTVFINTLYMITFFVALMVVDDRRIKADRYDLCVCFVRKEERYVGRLSDAAPEPTHAEILRREEKRRASLLSNRVMDAYSRFLTRPRVKVAVLVLFASLFAVGAWIASGIKQGLHVPSLFPEGSQIRRFYEDLESYSKMGSVYLNAVYFRDVDVSDVDVQEAMLNYVEDIVELDWVSNEPFTFWLRDFRLYRSQNETVANHDGGFYEQLDMFLSQEPYRSLYKNDVVRDPDTGVVLSSRTMVLFDNVRYENVEDYIDAFRDTWEVTDDQEINARGDPKEPKFFTFGDFYFFWELWSILLREILITVILSLCALFLICLVFVNHPLASLLLPPTVFVVYVEIIAVYRIAGLQINAVTAIGLITCLGLVMDYATHVCITYFEIRDATNRDERVRKVVNTVGKSVLKGGFTTFLGVLFVSLNPELSFRTIFVTFIGITTLGVGHGLIFVPVVLSLVGPMGDVLPSSLDEPNNDEHEPSIRSENGVDKPKEETEEQPSGIVKCDSGISSDLNGTPSMLKDKGTTTRTTRLSTNGDR